MAPSHNSLQSVIAVLLDLAVEDVPFFFAERDDAAEWQKYFDFLRSRGFAVLAFRPQYEEALGCPYIAIGRSGRNAHAHCVLKNSGRLIHDPDPGGDGLTETLLLQILCPLDPSRHVVMAAERTAGIDANDAKE
jgi:hypothetical protein